MSRTRATGPLLVRHIEAIDKAAEELWKWSKYGVAASYSGQTWNDPRVTEEIREHWREQARIVVAAYKDRMKYKSKAKLFQVQRVLVGWPKTGQTYFMLLNTSGVSKIEPIEHVVPTVRCRIVYQNHIQQTGDVIYVADTYEDLVKRIGDYGP